MSKFLLRIAAVILAAGLVMAGCGNPTGGPTGGADKTDLTAKINEAEDLKSKTATSDDGANGADVDPGKYWVYEDDMVILDAVIATAKVVKNDALATQSAVDVAVMALGIAIQDFKEARTWKPDPIDRAALAAKITEAQNALDSVVQAENDEDVAIGAKWATPSQVETFDDAINAAIDVRDTAGTSQDAVNDEKDALNDAIIAFIAQVAANGPGTKNTGFTQDELTDLIRRAGDALDGVSTSEENGEDIPPTSTWVTPAVLTALNDAISAAGGTQADPNEAYLALQGALTAFNNGKALGVTPLNKPALLTAIGLADAAKDGVVTSTTGTSDGAPAGSAWVTLAQREAFQAVYDASLNTYNDPVATKNEVDLKVTALNAAVAAFENAVAANGLGTGANKITITGLSGIYINGVEVGVKLFDTNVFGEDEEGSGDDGPDIEGEGEISNGALTVELFDGNGKPWAGTGSYYAAFSLDGYIVFITKQKIAFNGGTVTVPYSDFELITYSMRLGDAYDGEFTSMTLNAFLAEATADMDGGPYNNLTAWKNAMKVMMEEEFGEYGYVNLNFLNYTLYKDQACTQAFNGGETVTPETVIYCKAWISGGSDEPDRPPTVGHITGTITLTGYSGQRPQVRINAQYSNQYMGGSWVDDWGTSYTINTDGSFSIPFAQEFLNELSHGAQNLEFVVSVGSGNSQFRVTVDYSQTVSSSNLTGTGDDRLLDVGNLGTVNLASITLSGTLTVEDNGKPLGRVHINARDAQDNYIASASLTNPSITGASWSINIPVQNGGAVTFGIYGYATLNGDEQVLSTTIEPESTASVTNTSISNISLNLGDISVGRMSGTVSFTNMPSPEPDWIGISARYGNWQWINNGQWFEIAVSNGTWTIPRDDAFLAALETGTQTVTFSIHVQMNQNESSFEVAQIEIPVSMNGLGSVSLGPVSLEFITLSGTITVHDNGNPLGRVYIDAIDAQKNYIRSAYLNYPDAGGASWSMHIPAQQGGAVTFRVYGYNSPSGGNQVLYTSLAPDTTAFVSTTSISGIVLDIGDISVGRMGGTISFADMPDPPPYRVSISARYGNWQWINNGQSYGIEVSGGTWTIPRDDAFLAALGTGDQTVTFNISVQMTESGSSFTVGQIEKMVNINGLTSIVLELTESINFIKLSGTAAVTYNGTPPYSVQIIARNQSQGQVASITLYSPSANAAWEIYLRPLGTPTDLSFTVLGMDSQGNRLFEANTGITAPGVYNSDVGNITLNYDYVLTFPPASSTPLTHNQWTDGTLTAGEEHWYTFNPAGGTYYVTWNDGYVNNGQGGDGTKTCDIRVTAFTSSGDIISGFAGVDYAYSSPRQISGQTGTVYLWVQGWSITNSGTYAIGYTQDPNGISSAGGGVGPDIDSAL